MARLAKNFGSCARPLIRPSRALLNPSGAFLGGSLLGATAPCEMHLYEYYKTPFDVRYNTVGFISLSRCGVDPILMLFPVAQSMRA